MNPCHLSTGGVDAEALGWVEALHALLLRGARFEIARRGGERARELDDLATQAADDAVMAVMRKLPTYRGDSRFTTWAYKFALLEAAVRMRKRAWHGQEVPLEADGWAQLESTTQGGCS